MENTELSKKGYVLGTDPEFVAVYRKTGKIRPAKHIISDDNKINAVGLDGQRTTASIELRPGISHSGEVLVDRMAYLLGRLRDHYHPPAIAYRSGAWVAPEPLGGHIHISWSNAPSRWADTFIFLGVTLSLLR
jgi:hypothetical protein